VAGRQGTGARMSGETRTRSSAKDSGASLGPRRRVKLQAGPPQINA